MFSMVYFQDVIGKEVKVLLALKEQYQTIAGKAWQPTNAKPTEQSKPTSSASSGSDVTTIDQQISDQGNKIRTLKGEKAAKVCP